MLRSRHLKPTGARPSSRDIFYATRLDELYDRARRYFSSQPRPFLRWAGSKRALLPHMVDVVPHRFGTYFEPFLGSAALFFALQPYRSVLNDACSDLIATFDAVCSNVDRVVGYLRPLRPSRAVFYRLRRMRSRGRFKRAAHFIYLNKTCWNGLYRVNSRGEFNVPYGLPKTSFIADLDNLRACANLLRGSHATLLCGDFEAAVSSAGRRDLVYLDPPYVTRHNNNGFVDYNETLFSWHDQERLARTALRLARKGAYVLVTNAYHKDILRMYPGFSWRPLYRTSTLASDTDSRGPVTEVLLYSRRGA